MKDCRWRNLVGDGTATCSSPWVKCLKPFDPAALCPGCAFIDHEAPPPKQRPSPSPRPYKPKLSIDELAQGRH